MLSLAHLSMTATQHGIVNWVDSFSKFVCRSLRLERVYDLLNGDMLPESFSTLTQLTCLELEECSTFSLAPVMTLPGLQ